MSDTQTIDRAALQNLLAMFNGDTAFLNQVIDTYLSDAASLLATVRQSAESGKPEDLRRAAHSLKSNSANLGAAALSGIARELEELSRSGAAADAGRVAALEAEFERVKVALQTVRDNGLAQA
jgi:two-component system sensor histidine kinase/response regulator